MTLCTNLQVSKHNRPMTSFWARPPPFPHPTSCRRNVPNNPIDFYSTAVSRTLLKFVWIMTNFEPRVAFCVPQISRASSRLIRSSGDVMHSTYANHASHASHATMCVHSWYSKEVARRQNGVEMKEGWNFLTTKPVASGVVYVPTAHARYSHDVQARKGIWDENKGKKGKKSKKKKSLFIAVMIVLITQRWWGGMCESSKSKR